jgi:hypothetical protein
MTTRAARIEQLVDNERAPEGMSAKLLCADLSSARTRYDFRGAIRWCMAEGAHRQIDIDVIGWREWKTR